ncbi:intermembrane phospholipid transport protein YdbH family protein [Stakelama tenebrarum]|uniref:Uncharacterized protein n=1 Tax=Stakelama tenebrarum TaxID=2711215 RepID=A0A6G6Y2S9_9SPHN|nr:YdbH domain-containing protein [Sphingosinithalassobacter tenebrarum]QIG79232.1 hypothetical protein G5C33_05110 [Sphingosinithalassobacter tenebrarum]
MTETAANEVQQGRRWRGLLRALVALLAVLGIVLAVLWFRRREIADDFIARELASRGVPARYSVEEIGFRTQRLSDVVIGDPADPDLVAEWIEVDIDLFSGARVSAVRLGPARLSARLEDGKLSLGHIDKLMPPPSGKPFALPEMRVDIADLRVRLDSGYGAVGLKISGKGRLDDGFRGRMAAVAPELAVQDCIARDVRIVGDLGIARGAPALRGPVRAAALDCGDVRARGVRGDVELGLDSGFAQWRGDLTMDVDRLAGQGVQAERLGGRLRFEGDATLTSGSFDLDAQRIAAAPGEMDDVRLQGSFRLAEKSIVAGALSADRIAPSRATLASLDGMAQAGAGTPVAPLADKLARAVATAARSARGSGQFSLSVAGGRSIATVTDLALAADSGARVRLTGDPAIRYDSAGGITLNGSLTMDGGDLPEARIALTQAAPGAPIIGQARIAPYAAGNARLTLEPVEFRATSDGVTRIATRATLSGPLPDGQVERLTLPLVARWNGAGRLTVNAACVPAGFERLEFSALTLEATRLTLCPEGAGMVTVSNGRVSGGVRARDMALVGRIGETPLRLSADSGRFTLADANFALAGVETRIGSGDSMTRIDVADLTGIVADGKLGGVFSGAEGQIGQVPLLLSEGAGDWTLAAGKLTLDGGLRVADAAEEPRFNPLESDDILLTLYGNQIEAGGTLHLPEREETVTAVTLEHDLGSGAGQAVLDVRGLRFDPEGLQPAELTRLTYGVIADVRGEVSGQGRIAWNGNEVTSDGSFRTENTDLSAAFGPVTGFSTEIAFGDLLGLATPEGQVQTATVTLLNPGIPVEDGTIRYRLLGEQKIAIEDGRWPFAGGELVLEPTVLDFGQQVEREMVFRAKGVDAARFLQEADFDNLDATGVFDGVLPIVFDSTGGTVKGGRLESRNGGTIAYVGELTQEDLGVWGNYAFQALKSLRYRSLDLEMDGPLDGEMVTRIRFAGVGQGEDAKSDFITRRLTRLPIVFNITIRAKFRQLVRSVQSWYDPSILIETQLPELIEEQRRTAEQPETVQPEESEDVP